MLLIKVLKCLKMRNSLIILIIAFSLGSCKTAKLPLCYSLTKTNPSPQKGISKTLYDICKEKNIEVLVLSSTVAEFKGSSKNIKWLISNYPIIICDFDQDEIDQDEKIYRICMINSLKWIELMQKGKPEDLMLDESEYSICVD